MKRSVVIVLIIALIAGLGLFAAKSGEVYENDEFGVRFEIPEGYKVEERGSQSSYSITLYDEEFVPVEGGEGPPAINVVFHRNPSQTEPEDWVKNNPLSNYQLSGGILYKDEVAGKRTITYSATGLYESDNAVLLHRDAMVHMSAGYMSSDDKIREDFEDILSNIEFR